MRWLYTVGVFLLIATCASPGQTIKSAYCGDDGILQTVYEDGTTKPQPKEHLQVGCDNATVADDKETVGWSVLVGNCCTSYPVPTSVAVLSHGRKRVFSVEQMVWQWRFVSGAKRLALLSGPVHGNAVKATLYDVRSGRLLATWDGGGEAPSWASGWKPEFGPSYSAAFTHANSGGLRKQALIDPHNPVLAPTTRQLRLQGRSTNIFRNSDLQHLP